MEYTYIYTYLLIRYLDLDNNSVSLFIWFFIMEIFKNTMYNIVQALVVFKPLPFYYTLTDK